MNYITSLITTPSFSKSMNYTWPWLDKLWFTSSSWFGDFGKSWSLKDYPLSQECATVQQLRGQSRATREVKWIEHSRKVGVRKMHICHCILKNPRNEVKSNELNWYPDSCTSRYLSKRRIDYVRLVYNPGADIVKKSAFSKIKSNSNPFSKSIILGQK